MKENTNVVNAAKKIWAIAGESPEMGNAVMDLIGDEAYNKVMELQKIQLYDPNKKTYAIIIKVYSAEDDANYSPIYAIFDDLDIAVNCVHTCIDDIIASYEVNDDVITRIEIQSRVLGVLEDYDVERQFDIWKDRGFVEEYKMDMVYDDNHKTEEECGWTFKRIDFGTFPIRKTV